VSALKLQLIQFELLPPFTGKPAAVKKQLLLARETLELACILSVHARDVKSFERHVAQVRFASLFIFVLCLIVFCFVETLPTRHDNTIRHDTTRHDTTRHNTTRHDTTRHDTTRHDTTRTI
jgi:hypothetical protein